MNFILVKGTAITAVDSIDPDHPDYSLEDAAHLTGLHPDLLRYYCRLGLLVSEEMRDAPENEWRFNDDTLYEIRRIEHCRWHYGVNIRALPLVLKLLREIENLDREVRVLRESM